MEVRTQQASGASGDWIRAELDMPVLEPIHHQHGVIVYRNRWRQLILAWRASKELTAYGTSPLNSLGDVLTWLETVHIVIERQWPAFVTYPVIVAGLCHGVVVGRVRSISNSLRGNTRKGLVCLAGSIIVMTLGGSVFSFFNIIKQ